LIPKSRVARQKLIVIDGEQTWKKKLRERKEKGKKAKRKKRIFNFFLLVCLSAPHSVVVCWYGPVGVRVSVAPVIVVVVEHVGLQLVAELFVVLATHDDGRGGGVWQQTVPFLRDDVVGGREKLFAWYAGCGCAKVDAGELGHLGHVGCISFPPTQGVAAVDVARDAHGGKARVGVPL